jgi:hypothetical protein
MTKSTTAQRDALVCRYLKSLPGYDQWTGLPLPPEIEQYLRTADRQQAMTAAALILGRLWDEP